MQKRKSLFICLFSIVALCNVAQAKFADSLENISQKLKKAGWKKESAFSNANNPLIKNMKEYWTSNDGKRNPTDQEILDDMQEHAKEFSWYNRNEELGSAVADFIVKFYAGQAGYKFGNNNAKGQKKGQIAYALLSAMEIERRVNVWTKESIKERSLFIEKLYKENGKPDHVQSHLKNCKDYLLDALDYLQDADKFQGNRINSTGPTHEEFC